MKRYIRSKLIHFLQYLGERYKIKIIPDKLFLQLLYQHKVGSILDLSKPQSFTEKIQWLKLNDHNPNYTLMADKYEVKLFVANLLEEDITIPTIGLYNRCEEIPFSTLPQSFVIKCTHDWNSVIICTDKNKFDLQAAIKKINNALKYNHYYRSLEWAYKHIPPRIIVEPFLSEDGITPPIDYRVYCFDGIPHFIHLTLNKFSDRRVLFVDTDWNIIPVGRQGLSTSNTVITKPLCLSRMIEIAKRISNNIPFLRVDFYIVKSKLYLGECTFYPAEGFKAFSPIEFNRKIGDLIPIPFNRKI